MEEEALRKLEDEKEKEKEEEEVDTDLQGMDQRLLDSNLDRETKIIIKHNMEGMNSTLNQILEEK